MSKGFTAVGLTMAQTLELDPDGTTYTFVEKDHRARPTHIASGVMWQAVHRRLPVTRCFIAPTLVAALVAGSLGVEPPHALKLPDSALDTPAMVCEWGPDHVIADGNHRLWRRWKRGDDDFPAYVIPETLWRHFVITDMPGDADFWDTFNREAHVRTPEMARLLKLLTGR